MVKKVKPVAKHRAPDFGMVRITHAKEVVDVSTSTIREYARLGLKIYRVGKATYFSKVELEHFIRSQAA